MQNPIERVTRTRSSPYPIVVCCVVMNLSKYDDRDVRVIKEYAISENTIFETRVYNSYKYSEDRYFIERLPAFHIIVNGAYRRTFYPNTRPLQHIEECITEYKESLARKRRSRDYWRNLFPNTLTAIGKAVRRAFHRKTRMEVAQEERERQRKMDWK